MTTIKQGASVSASITAECRFLVILTKIRTVWSAGSRSGKAKTLKKRKIPDDTLSTTVSDWGIWKSMHVEWEDKVVSKQ